MIGYTLIYMNLIGSRGRHESHFKVVHESIYF